MTSAPCPRTHRSGLSLVEALVVLALIGSVIAAAAPAWIQLRSRASLRVAASTLRGELRSLRAEAIARGSHVGWDLTQKNGSWTIRQILDGDGDGLRRRDLERGIDRPLGPERPLLPPDCEIAIGIRPAGIPDPSDPDRRLGPETRPIRFGSSGFISFSPLGASTPGSIFLTDRSGRAWCLRLNGANARPHLLQLDDTVGTWRELH